MKFAFKIPDSPDFGPLQASDYLGKPFYGADSDKEVLGRVYAASAAPEGLTVYVEVDPDKVDKLEKYLNQGRAYPVPEKYSMGVFMSPGRALSWQNAEARLRLAAKVNKYARTENLQGDVEPHMDRRQYRDLQAQALEGLEFPSLEVAEAFFGGLYTGTAICRVQSRGNQARALVAQRNTLVHKLWGLIKRLENLPGYRKILTLAKDLILAETGWNPEDQQFL